MFKMGGGALCLLILTVFFAFSYVGCVQEEIGPQASLGEDVVLAKKGDVGDLYKDGGWSDCNCYMSITGITGVDEGQFWSFRDITNVNYFPLFSFSGFGNQYNDPFSGGLSSFPTPFSALAPPKPGCHHFRFILVGEIPQNEVVLHATVRCYTERKGVEVLATETFPNFVFQDGTPQNGYEGIRLFWKRVSCTTILEGEEDCVPSPGGGSSF